jgi:hypothetical protein
MAMMAITTNNSISVNPRLPAPSLRLPTTNSQLNIMRETGQSFPTT